VCTAEKFSSYDWIADSKPRRSRRAKNFPRRCHTRSRLARHVIGTHTKRDETTAAKLDLFAAARALMKSWMSASLIGHTEE
jgi:hypothetical protein